MGNEKQILLQSISAYAPGLIVRRVIADSHSATAGQGERFDAALLFADVSGFTAMSENLAQLGKEGAEELTRVLNDYFSAMIDLVRSYGGQVIKFGGDAITCAFANGRMGEWANGQIDESASVRMNVRRACACALAMQEKTIEFQAVETKGGVFELRMKIGISAGPVLFFSLLGEREIGLEYVLAGRPLDRMSEAEHHAVAGEVVLDGTCVAGVGPASHDWADLGIVVGERRGEFWLVSKLTQVVHEVQDKDVDWSVLSKDAAKRAITQLSPYLPPEVYGQIVQGQRQFVGGHRQVVSLFVNFFGLDYDTDPDVGAKLQQYFGAMQEIIHRYGGRLNRIITGDKGSTLHLIFGALMMHEDNEARAVGCALEMQQSAVSLKSETNGQPFITDQQIGVTTGYVFAGNVGSEQRQEFTVMGDVVNLSARLMQAAGMWEILIDRATARRAETEFTSEELTPIRVKGKQEPVSIYRPVGARSETKAWGQRESPIVGREQELAEIKGIIERVTAGHGQLLVITGEAGVGKSRLLEELIALAREKGDGAGMYGVRGDCSSYRSQSPYLPWIDFFTSFFGLGAGEVVAEKIHRIEQRMAKADPALDDWVPLLGQLMGLPTPDNQLTASLDAQLRKQRTFDITLALLRHQAQQAPFFLAVFEDVHWMDSISLEMLNHVARNIAGHRILLVALHRPTVELAEWKRYDHYNHVELADLSAEDALKLAEFKLGMEQVPAPLRERVLRGQERVNPFFVEELIDSLIARGYLVSQGEGQGYELVRDLSQAEIPDSVQALVMSRIDRLDESSQLTVKVASVVGRTFQYRPLLGVYPVDIVPRKLRGNLKKLSSLNLTPLDRPAPEWEYIFRHVTTQEVAYESLLYAHRRELHLQMGEYLERMYPDNLEEHYELLAHHYYQSGDREKSWDYLVKAGDKARDKYANESAIVHYNHALSLDFEAGNEPENAHHVYESRGDVHRLIGQYEKALKSYLEALEHQPTAAQTAEIQRKIAKTWEQQGRYDEAMQCLNLTRAALGERKETPEMARIYSDMGWIAMRRGDYQEALQLCAQGLEVANCLPDDEKSQKVKTRLEHTWGAIYLQMGDYHQAITHFQTCIEIQESINDLVKMSASHNNLAAVYWGQGNYDLAVQYFHKSLETSQKIGDTYGTAMCYNNLGGTCYVLGDYHRAIEHYERSLEIRREIGDWQGIGDVYNNLGEVHHSLGNCPQALHYLRQAVELFTEIGDKGTLIDAYKLLAEVELELSNVDEAQEYCQRSLELAREIRDREFEGIAYRVLGQIHRAAARPGEARQYLQNSVETLATVESRLELGKSYYELGITLLAMELEEGQAQLQQAIRIFEELGVEGELEKARAAVSV